MLRRQSENPTYEARPRRLTSLTKFVRYLSEYPSVQQRIREHLRETETQLKRLDACLQACGESASGVKDTAMSLFGNMAAAAHAAAPDEILKNTFANEAFENYEIAAYKSLLALCNRAGLSQSMGLLQDSLAEEAGDGQMDRFARRSGDDGLPLKRGKASDCCVSSRSRRSTENKRVRRFSFK